MKADLRARTTIDTGVKRTEHVDMDAVTWSGPIRYATAGRFQPPRQTDPLHPRLTDGSVCPQQPSRLEPVTGPPPERHPQSEDCLALSVVAPTSPGPHPVMVFLHGGAFVTGSGLAGWYDGAALAAEHGVVVVSVNYRLGPFGWLLLDGVSPGNLGLLDQMTALHWVHEAIGRYGGAPDSVTFAGQSAGGGSIGRLLEIPEARALFRRVIVQSGAAPDLLPDVDHARQAARRLGEMLDDDPVTVDAETLLDAAGRVTGQLPAGTAELPIPPWTPLAGIPPVPSAMTAPTDPESLHMLIGWTHDELTAFGHDLDAAPDLTRRLFADPWIRDAARWSAAGVSVTGYRLDWRPHGSPYGATHCLELPLLLGSQSAWSRAPMLGDSPWATIDDLGRRLRATWAQFARDGTVDPRPTADAPVTWALDGDLSSLRESPSSCRTVIE